MGLVSQVSAGAGGQGGARSGQGLGAQEGLGWGEGGVREDGARRGLHGTGVRVGGER